MIVIIHGVEMSTPRDPVVPSERKWDRVSFNIFWRVICTLLDSGHGSIGVYITFWFSEHPEKIIILEYKLIILPFLINYSRKPATTPKPSITTHHMLGFRMFFFSHVSYVSRVSCRAETRRPAPWILFFHLRPAPGNWVWEWNFCHEMMNVSSLILCRNLL